MNFGYNRWQEQGLKYNPFKKIVAPRPIGWASTLSKEGQLNLAPFSYFNAINTEPEQVMLSISNRGHMHKEKFGFEINSPKDTLKNIKPKLFIEIHGLTYYDKEKNIINIVSLLEKFKYKILHVESGELINKNNAISAKIGHIYCT